MLKCKIDNKKSRCDVKVDGSGYDLLHEVLVFIRLVYKAIKRSNPNAAEGFKRALIENLTFPDSGVWKAD